MTNLSEEKIQVVLEKLSRFLEGRTAKEAIQDAVNVNFPTPTYDHSHSDALQLLAIYMETNKSTPITLEDFIEKYRKCLEIFKNQ